MGQQTADLVTALMTAAPLCWAVNPLLAIFKEARRRPAEPRELLNPPAVPYESAEQSGQGSQESGDLCKALISSGIFKKTNRDALLTWVNQLRPVHFPAGHVVVEDGDFGGCLYVIVSGKVKVCRRRPHDREIVLNILGPSDILGAIALFTSGGHDVTATTLTDVLVAPIERDRFRFWMAQCPEIRGQMLRLLARWTKTMTSCLVDYASVDAEARVASRLLFLMRRFGRREGDCVRVDHDLSIQDFSLLVGVAPQTIRATLRNFEERGWIRLEDNSLMIVDAQALGWVRPAGGAEVCHV